MEKKRYLVGAFILLFSGSMLIHMITNNVTMTCDSYDYWQRGIECGWNVNNLTSGFRGYLLPYLFGGCYSFGMLIGNQFFGYWIFSSLVFAFTFTVSFFSVAKLLQWRISDKHIVGGGVFCGVIFFYYFRGLFIYTLSDFYAFAISLFSIILLDIILNRKQTICKKGVEGCILGLCLYGAYNIRTIYLFLGIASLGVLTASQLYKKKWTNLVVTLLACFVGIVMCAIPQMIVNNNLGGGYSWQVSTGGLMSSQIQWGINYQRYGTYIGDPLEYGDIRMFYIDNIGQTILNRAQITDFGSGIAFIKNFIKLIVDYPLDFIGIYVRHFLNMLYPIYPEQYIQEITKDKSLLLILFYSLFFIATSNFIYLFKQGGNSWRWICLILVPCFCILPGAVEIRFFIALHFLIYIYAVLGIKEFWGRLKKNKKRYICVYVIGLLLYIAYGGMLLATTAAGTATINNL